MTPDSREIRPEDARLTGFASALVLAGVVLSVALAVFAWSAPDLGAFALSNQVPLPERIRALVIGAALAASAVAACAWGIARHREGTLHGWASALVPLLVSVAVPVLFSRDAWIGAELDFLLVVGLVAIVFERLLRPSFASRPVLSATAFAGRLVDRLPPRTGAIAAWTVVVLGVLYYFLRISAFTILSHHRMATSSSDLAEFDNLFFNALHGHPFRSPAIEGELQNWSALKVHAEFGLYLLLPFYALHPGPEALLVIQSGVVALTAIPIFLFASGWLGRAGGALFALVYLSLPAVQQANFYDYHFTPLGMFWVAWTLALIDRHLRLGDRAGRRSLIAVSVAFACALLSREDVAFGLTVVGAVVLFGARRARLGLVLATVAAVYFVLMKFVVMPRFGTMWFASIYQDLQAPGAKGFGAMVLTLLSNPTFALRKLLIEPKFVYVLELSVPLLFLWFRRPWLLCAALPGLPFTLLVTNRPPMSQISFQYVYHWIPYVVCASAIGLRAVSNAGDRDGPSAQSDSVGARRRAGLVALSLAALACTFQFGALLGARSIIGGFGPKMLDITRGEEARLARLEKLIQRIPAAASVVASEREGPHVSTRLVMYSLKFTFGQTPDYVLVTSALGEGERAHLRGPMRAGKYGLVAREGEFFLLRRGADPRNNRTVVNQLRL